MLCNCSLSALLFYGLMIIAFEIKSCVLPFSLFLQLYCWISKMQHYLQALKLNTFIFAEAIYTIRAGNSWQLRDKSVKSILTESFSLSLSLWFDDCKTVKFQKLSTNCVSFKDFLVDEVKQGKETAKMPEAILDKIFWSQNTHRWLIISN